MAGDEKSEERGFTIVDRRASASASASGGEGEPAEAGPEAAESLPSIDFSTFVISLGTSAFYHMGLVDDPDTGKHPETNLVLARQTIDTLSMLEEKTRGNLEKEEAQLVESLLYELRMRFVEAGK